MKLNTGKVAFNIEFDNGDVGTIYINPTDPYLAVRLTECGKNIEGYVKDLGGVEISPSGEAADHTNDSNVETIRKCTEIIKSELDKAFGSDVSSVVFKHCSPIAIVDGNFFVIDFLEAISPEIVSLASKAQIHMNKNIDNRLAKYGK